MLRVFVEEGGRVTVQIPSFQLLHMYVCMYERHLRNSWFVVEIINTLT